MNTNLNNQTTFECECITTKTYRVIFDGGSTGNYVIEMCQQCYDADDKRFVITEEMIL